MNSREGSDSLADNTTDSGNGTQAPPAAAGDGDGDENNRNRNGNNNIPDMDNVDVLLNESIEIDDENDDSQEALDVPIPNVSADGQEPPGPPPIPARERRFFRRGLNLRPLNNRTIAAGLAGLLSIDNGGLDLDDDEDDTLDLDADDETSQNETNDANPGESSDEPREVELHEMGEVSAVLKLWEEKQGQENFDPIPYLTRLAEIVEGENEQYLKLDPDPFDDRHPCRTHPSCGLGHSLKALFKKEAFMSKLVHTYLNCSGQTELSTVACRLFIDILPGLETSVVYQETEGLITKLFEWAETGPEPLQSYSLGLLGASMELPDVASKFRDKNFRMVGLMLTRLRNLQEEFLRPFGQFSSSTPKSSAQFNTSTSSSHFKRKRNSLPSVDLKTKKPKIDADYVGDELCFGAEGMINGFEDKNEASSSSSWAELEPNIIGEWKVHPISLAMKQIFTLRYLSPLGEYQEMLGYAYEHNAIELILNYLDTQKTKDSRLTFEALKYLSALLCHKKFALEFIRCNGLQKLLQVPRPSVSATGVSLSLYYIAYSEDAMMRVCQMPRSVLNSLTNYVMWLLECSHTSGRNHALMFFGVVYPFKIMLDLFDHNDGLRRVLNIISTQPDFRSDDKVSDEDQLVTRQIVKHVCCNLKRYFECHLSFLGEKLKRMKGEIDDQKSPVSSNKPLKHEPEALRELNNIVLEQLPLWVRWHPVDKLVRLGGLQILMQALALAYDWNYSGRAETVKSVLDVLSICCLVPRVQLLLTERFNLGASASSSYGLSIILSAAEGEVASDPDVQRSALLVLGNCVCGPKNRTGSSADSKSGSFVVPRTPVRKSLRSSDDLLHRIWECVRVNNGILILTRLLLVKTPITDADSLRALACWCLSGLARYQPVCQVLEQLPIMQSGLIHILMREPILQEKRQEHVLFQKYGMEILRQVYGKQVGVDYALSMVAIHKSDLISQTKIQYNEKQLLELIHEHLRNKGLHESAEMLTREASLSPSPPPTPVNALTPVITRKNKTAWNFPSKQRGREITLDTIVKEYLTNQHSLCKTPMVTCPTFDLIVPHKCPAPKARSTCANFGSRVVKPFWTPGSRFDKKQIYSKFKPFRTIRAEQDQFSSCAFSSCHQWVIVGTHNGQIKLFNNSSANEDGTYACHDSEIYHVEPNKKGSLLLTSSVWRRPLSALWKMEGLFDKVIEFEREEYAEFSKLNQDKVIATNIDHAYIYDIETTKKIFSLEPKISNSYHKNRATFDPTDSLVLSDGVLWDCRGGTEIHKFDKLNENVNGVFHPNGLEIIANSEVWDCRTFKLLCTVKSLDQSYVTFTSLGDIIYGIKADKETSEGFKASDTSFVTLDAQDYSSIGTIELKRSISCLASSPNDLQIVLVESHYAETTVSDSCIRYYDVGRSKDTEEGDEEDDVQSHDSEEEDNEEGDDDEDDNDDDLDVDRLLDELLPEDETIELDSQDDTEGDQDDAQSGQSDDSDDDDEVEEYEVASLASTSEESDEEYDPNDT